MFDLDQWMETYERWRGSEGAAREPSTTALLEMWPLAWEAGDSTVKGEILWLLAVSGNADDQHLIWDAMKSPDPELRSWALTASPVSVSREDWMLRPQDYDALWECLADPNNESPINALTVLSLIGRDYEPARLQAIVEKAPDGEVRRAAASILESGGPSKALLARYRRAKAD